MEDRLSIFEKSIGKNFKVDMAIGGPSLVDEIAGVDRKNNHVCGKKFGNFHVDLCILVEAPAATIRGNGI